MSDKKEFEKWLQNNCAKLKSHDRLLMFEAWQAARQPRFTEAELADIIRYEIEKSTIRHGTDRALKAIQALKEAGVIRVKGKEDAGN